MNKIQKAIIFVWYDCNESCFFCSAEVHGRKHINRSTKEILTDIISMKSAGAISLEFIWWEVLMRNDISVLLAFAHKAWFDQISIETNGEHLANKNFAEKILQLWLNRIVLSIHGNSSKINDQHTWALWSFEKKLQAIENLQILWESYNFQLFVNYVVTSKNLDEVPWFIARMDQFSWIQKYIFAFVRPLKKYKKLYHTYLPKFIDIKRIFESFALHEKVRIQYLPHCVLDIQYNNLYQQWMERGLKWEVIKINETDIMTNLEDVIQEETAYFSDCKNCKLAPACRGVWSEYIEFFHMESPPLLNWLC